MEKFFEVKGTTFEKLYKVFFKVVVIPLSIVLITAIISGKDYIIAISIAVAAIYLAMFYFKAKCR